jgi:hypothetical protein
MFEKQTDNTPERPAEYAVQTKQENVTPVTTRTEIRESARAEREIERRRKRGEPIYDKSIDFTAGERWGTWALNAVPGLGSAVIMKDYKGAIINAAVGGVGALGTFVIGYGGMIEDSFGYSVHYTVVASCVILWIGGGSAWNIYRSITYHHPDSRKIAATPLQGLNVAVLPDPDGNIKGYVAYRVEF